MVSAKEPGVFREERGVGSVSVVPNVKMEVDEDEEDEDEDMKEVS